MIKSHMPYNLLGNFSELKRSLQDALLRKCKKILDEGGTVVFDNISYTNYH
jgi:hypothetical protein